MTNSEPTIVPAEHDAPIRGISVETPHGTVSWTLDEATVRRLDQLNPDLRDLCIDGIAEDLATYAEQLANAIQTAQCVGFLRST